MARLVAGLCSITLRSLTAEEVIGAAQAAGVGGIEWGADVHVRPGDLATAAAVARRGRDLGIEVCSYGSYLGVAGPDAPDEVERVLDTAEALGTTAVRAWTTLGVTPDVPAVERDRVRDHTAALADAAARRGLAVALEFHPGTLTHTAVDTVALLEDIGRPNLATHWQPDPTLPPDRALDELRRVLPHLAELHVFTWGPAGIDDRRPLADGAALWPAALALAASTDRAGPRYALCEYVRDDSPEQLARDVTTLQRWIDDLDRRPGPGSP
ncbi:MAG: sugar phosphate isomerase/epimerase family protein [Iamia sp.]